MQPDVFRSELGPGERIIWTGAPDRSVRFASGDLVAVPFSLLWAGFVSFALLQALKDWGSGAGSGFGLVFLIPFVLIGAYITVGRFIARDIWKRRTQYAVTNHRILTLSTWPRRVTQSMRLQDIPSIEVSSTSGPTGTITFSSTGHGQRLDWGQRLSSQAFSPWSAWSGGVVAFVDIPEARDLSRKIERLRSEGDAGWTA